ncbi:conjugal transfer protein TraF [Delftia lacustris]|uniref:Conjugal transfer pilus assembly protein TraF n=1 Tax=Delftia lacustris TaxID=558537 RepID=A0A1H3SII1_9BURK|nr:conjugal transfer protein TraF [Delftia lacustris]SDZ37395.1 conjugal transfer pilus assembly protein TraF [Delftia lacustris]
MRTHRPALLVAAVGCATATLFGLASAQGTASPAPVRDSPPPYWFDGWRGWHFYEDPPSEAPPSIARPVPTTPPRPAEAPRPPELAEFERLQKTLEDLRNIAIMRPTEANVRHYMQLEMQVVNRASYFADVAQRVAWATPELDPTLKGRPVNALALEVFDHQQRSDRSTSVESLGRDHVLFFFYRSDCPYCHAFAPTLQAFEARHGIQVVAVSVDGGPMPGFPKARPDNGIATALKVTQVPAVFLAQPYTGKITPIGFGVLSESQLLERIATVASPTGEAMLPSATQRLALP